MRKRDILLHHPYDSFVSSVERFVEQAVNDPDVLAIKQTVYRTSDDSPLVPALIRAAERGKQAVCLVEVKARFDERANIQWGRALEEAGVHVVYGLPSLKTHAKCILVVRREGDGVRHYLHVGTGNYNAKTARLYTDFGLLTCDEEIGADVADMFNFLTGFARPRGYRKVLVAPAHLRHGVIEEIERTIAVHQDGQPRADPDEDELARRPRVHPGALPRVPGGRAGRDQHARHLLPEARRARASRRTSASSRSSAASSSTRGSTPSSATASSTVYIGSADLMPRNLDTRVELLTPIRDETPARRPRRHARPLLRRQRQRVGAGLRGQLHPPHARATSEPRSVQRELMTAHAAAAAEASQRSQRLGNCAARGAARRRQLRRRLRRRRAARRWPARRAGGAARGPRRSARGAA